MAFNRSTSNSRSNVVRGVVGIDFATPVLIEDCTFTGFDQAIVAKKLVGHITIRRVSFAHNVAPALAHGGAVTVDSCNNLDIISCTFTHNKAELGGAIAVESTSFPASITVSNINTVGNSATTGGAIYVGKMS
jgi:predicted outer membrane repeat protein